MSVSRRVPSTEDKLEVIADKKIDCMTSLVAVEPRRCGIQSFSLLRPSLAVVCYVAYFMFAVYTCA